MWKYNEAQQKPKVSPRLFCASAANWKTSSFSCALISQSNLCVLFFQRKKDVDSVRSLLSGKHPFLVITWCFLHKRVSPCRTAPQPRGSHHPPELVYDVDLSLTWCNKSFMCSVLCHIFIQKIKQMLDCTSLSCRATQDWKRDEHSGAAGGEKSSGHIFRGIKHLEAINRLQPALFQPLCCLWIINVNRDRFVYFECGTTGAGWQDE